MSYLGWKVGDKIVCVDDAPSRARPVQLALRKGAVYTIREIGVFFADDAVAVRLEEIQSPNWWNGKEGAFCVSRFRPVQRRKTDISVFQRLLTHPRVTIGEDA